MGGPGNGGRDGGENLRTQTGGTLSPYWVAQLQGFPAGWLDSPTPVPPAARLATCADPTWPSRPGQPQAAWEAPRVLTDRMKDRGKALRALGNAAVPAQCFPLFKAIVEAEEGA